MVERSLCPRRVFRHWLITVYKSRFSNALVGACIEDDPDMVLEGATTIIRAHLPGCWVCTSMIWAAGGRHAGAG